MVEDVTMVKKTLGYTKENVKIKHDIFLQIKKLTLTGLKCEILHLFTIKCAKVDLPLNFLVFSLLPIHWFMIQKMWE